MKIYRQGDVLLCEIAELPAGSVALADMILIRGEATGHAHRLVGDGKIFRSATGQLSVLVEPGQKTQLVHEEHKSITLPVGLYGMIRQREYNPIEERTVMD